MTFGVSGIFHVLQLTTSSDEDLESQANGHLLLNSWGILGEIDELVNVYQHIWPFQGPRDKGQL